MNVVRYTREIMSKIFNEHITKNNCLSINKSMNIDLFQKYLDKLEKEIKIITNRHKAENNIFQAPNLLKYVASLIISLATTKEFMPYAIL